jgi:uncharacterized protein
VIPIFWVVFAFFLEDELMYIKISNLSDGVHNFTFDESVNKLWLVETFFGRFKADFELNKSHSQIILNAEISTKAHFECDRCGKEFLSDLHNQYQVVYLFGAKPEGELTDNVLYIPADADRIFIDNDLRDFAVLSIPMKKLCTADCKGLCFKCGKDLNEGECGCEKENIDARWQPLIELKNKLNNN